MPDLLDRYIDDERQKPFQWGRDNGDCLLFACGWGLRLHGVDYGASWRERYSTEAEARQLIEAYGGAVAAFTATLGSPRMGSTEERGDVGLLPYNGWYLGMICTGRMWAFRADRRGVRMIRRTPDFAWPMGFQR